MKFKYFPSKLSDFLFLWISSFLINIITFLLVVFKDGLKGENVALKYTVRSGVIWYGNGSNLYSLPLLALAVSILNIAIYRKLGKTEEFLPRAIAASTLFFQFLVLFSLILLAAQN